MTQSNPTDQDQLLALVGDLIQSADRNAVALAQLRTDQDTDREQANQDRQQAAVDRRRGLWTRMLAIGNAVGLMLDILLSIFAVLAIVALVHFQHQQQATNARQDCATSRTEAFLNAEHNKVTGQKAGWKIEGQGVAAQHRGVVALLAAKSSTAAHAALATYTGGVAMQQRGLAHVQVASQAYLDRIATLADKFHC